MSLSNEFKSVSQTFAAQFDKRGEKFEATTGFNAPHTFASEIQNEATASVGNNLNLVQKNGL